VAGFFALALSLAGALLVAVAYIGMAESRGVLRFFAYERLSERGKRAWKRGFMLMLLGAVLASISMVR
jgi:hypothetical protein